MVYGKRKCLKVFKNDRTAEIFSSSILCKGVEKMQYTLLGFGLTLAILLTVESLNTERM